MKGKVWGGTIQGASGVFNDRLINDDLNLIFEDIPMKSAPKAPLSVLQTPNKVVKKDPLLTFYEKDAEDIVERLLPDMGLTKYYNPETGQDGRQYTCSAGRMDILCIDNKTKDYVVLELKRGKAPDETLLQILRYMSWVRQNLSGNRNVKGIIMTESIDSSLSGMFEEVPNVSVQHYKFTIELVD